ncbi:MAG TPA: 1-deoxy-D-xylulose-5-phosphate synthase [Mariprofundaceae bacterium]|nr:1-deoxy-D-xylulose-5-phosphate synthase [Mariprofundaceae bacterium]
MKLEKYPLLSTIRGPEDVKRLDEEQLSQLAAEMRQYMIRILAPIGGHVGAGLGVIELSIALHRLFDSPRDRLVWDVGHQAYPHKMLTGRLTRMPTMRQHGGLSGFTKREESEHDPFGAGHACTSISAAYGMAFGRDLKKEDNHVIAVIGDGALTGGMAFEGLNNAGAGGHRLLVILNDNEMSIAPNVGSMSAYLARLITGKTYTSMRDATRKVLEKMPLAHEAAKRLEEHVKGMITPGTLFEEMGFRYIGPIDGHQFDHLLPTLENCKSLDGPVILHTVTKKGFGFAPAEEDPVTWHGLGPYDAETGEPVKLEGQPPTYTQVFADTLADMADTDPRIVAVTAAMPEGTGLSRFAKRHPERCIDVGIAEQHAVTFAAGLAVEGFRPVVAIYSTFMQRAFDQIVHDVCIQGLPVIFCMDRAGIVGADGATHAGSFDIAFLRCLPHITLMAPKDEAELRDMLATAIELDTPCAIRYPRGTGYGIAPETPKPLQPGRAEVLESGADGLVVAVGSRVRDALAAVETLRREEGKHFTLVNLRFIKPLDEETLRAHLEPGKPLMVVEEGSVQGGVGEAIAACAAANGWHGPFAHMGIPDTYPPHGTQGQVLRDLSLDAEAITERLRMLGRA